MCIGIYTCCCCLEVTEIEVRNATNCTYNFLKQDRQVAYNIDSIIEHISTPDVRYHRALEDTKTERCLIGPTHSNVNSARRG